MDIQPTIGRTVHYAPPQDCVGAQTLEKYASIITQINGVGPGESAPTVELVTFGPNSVYFQHHVAFSEEPKAGHWFWPART